MQIKNNVFLLKLIFFSDGSVYTLSATVSVTIASL